MPQLSVVEHQTDELVRWQKPFGTSHEYRRFQSLDKSKRQSYKPLKKSTKSIKCKLTKIRGGNYGGGH